MKHRMGWVAGLVALCGASSLSGQVRREIQFPDLPGQRTLKCDFHIHTVFSDGDVWPVVRVNEAWREGLDAISITDHLEYNPHKEDVKRNHNRPFEVAAGRAKELGILLVRGAEITRDTPPGHFNAIFLKDVSPLDTKDFYEVFRQAAGQAAFITWNHPGWMGPERGKWGEAQTRLLEGKQLHAIEVCNGDEYYLDAHRYAVEKGLPVLGCSDMHPPSSDQPWTAVNHRTLTLVFARDKSEAALREALFAGRTAAWWQDQLVGPEPYLGALVAACVEARPPHHRTKEHVWLEIRNRCELNVELQQTAKDGARISIPARSTIVARLNPNTIENGATACKVLNCLTAPNQPLQVKLAIPDAAAASRPAEK